MINYRCRFNHRACLRRVDHSSPSEQPKKEKATAIHTQRGSPKKLMAHCLSKLTILVLSLSNARVCAFLPLYATSSDSLCRRVSYHCPTESPEITSNSHETHVPSHLQHASIVMQPAEVAQNVRRMLGRRLVALLFIMAVSSSSAAYGQESYQWNFGNDKIVELVTPLDVNGGMRLTHPVLLGAGSGGAVFSMQNDKEEATLQPPLVAVKISWTASAASISKECKILQKLEQQSVHGVERCLATAPYPSDSRRVMMVLEPVVVDDANSIDDIRDLAARSRAMNQLMETLVEMMAARVVTTDVQLLVSQSGDILLIDLTEAKKLSSYMPLAAIDMALANSFCSEMLALVPRSMHFVAEKALTQALAAHSLDNDLYQVLTSQREILQT
ncbi:hypothetical protein MPSEU_000814000 [Mayamaea pseudoterrestris]|nr:hypothetical protein MPSEU_000814000 [Mayamaea pseudoterrestris]